MHKSEAFGIEIDAGRTHFRPGYKEKTFVANRVAEIQSKMDPKDWRHIPSHDNPADMLSRGQPSCEFTKNSLWNNGPVWLKQHESSWPVLDMLLHTPVPEIRKATCVATIASKNDLIHRYSSINRLRRIVAYCLRFKIDNHFKGSLTTKELELANICIIKIVQEQGFPEDIENLRHNRLISRKSRLLPLTPFLDHCGILRVGGRLEHSNIPFTQKHPAILPNSHHVTRLIIQHEHLDNHHAGITTTLYALRRSYWLIDGRNQVRKVIRECVKCFRLKPTTINNVMGNLPQARVTEARPFYNVSIDYCGPFFIKERRYRNRNRIKFYVAVFVCLAVKAVHMEVVSDMSTETFIAALRRFIARRGKPQNIYSDNGTNFVGANNELREILQSLQQEKHNHQVNNYLVDKGINWHFIPPASPHFGGLWESAVKSYKHHMRRVIGTELFTFEDILTFVIEVEAILNSRPLTPISSDPNDLIALTPGHALIGDSLTSLPSQEFRSTPTNRLSTWQHIQKVKQDFWTRWHKEYINELNMRHKWTSGHHNIKEGTVVVIKDDNVPPMQWVLGRIVDVHPGTDGVVRAVTIKTATTTLKRNVTKLAPLPITLES